MQQRRVLRRSNSLLSSFRSSLSSFLNSLDPHSMLILIWLRLKNSGYVICFTDHMHICNKQAYYAMICNCVSGSFVVLSYNVLLFIMRRRNRLESWFIHIDTNILLLYCFPLCVFEAMIQKPNHSSNWQDWLGHDGINLGSNGLATEFVCGF